MILSYTELLVPPVGVVPEDIRLIYIDLFCGFGGSGKGIEDARVRGKKIAIVIAAINHDEKAIESHQLNYDHVWHFREDVRNVQLPLLAEYVAAARKLYPSAKVVLWASPDCTQFSLAKGGLPKNRDSRMLAECLYDYIPAIDPDYIKVENVKEFQSWGPMRVKAGKKVLKQGVQIATELQTTIDKSTKEMVYKWEVIPEHKGEYYDAWKARICSRGYTYDFRYLNAADFGGYTIRTRYFGVFVRKGLPRRWPKATHRAKPDMFTKAHKAVKDVLDLNNKGESLFSQVNKYCEATFERIYKGIIKNYCNGIDPLLTGYYGNGSNDFTVKKPCGALTTKDRFYLVSPKLIDQTYGTSLPNPDSQPTGTITKVPKLKLLQVQKVTGKDIVLIDSSQYVNVPKPITEPAATITASRHWHYLVNPQWGSAGQKVDNPCFTLISRMDKAPPQLVSLAMLDTDLYQPALLVHADEHQASQKLKNLMAELGIVDIYYRGLTIEELLEIQGLGAGYKYVGGSTDAKRMIGNSVHPLCSRALCESYAEALIDLELDVAA